MSRGMRKRRRRRPDAARARAYTLGARTVIRLFIASGPSVRLQTRGETRPRPCDPAARNRGSISVGALARPGLRFLVTREREEGK